MALVVVVGGFLIIAYGYYTFTELNHQLSIKDDIISRITQRKNEINNQLKVVYTHTTKLEQALKITKEKHKETKLELLTKLNEFDANLTKTKHEAHNRFNALDTDYKMLKANYDEIQENHAALQQQYVRLSEDHKHVASEAKLDYDKLRDAKEAESISLQNRIQDLFNGKIYYQEKAKQNQEYYENTMKKYEEIKKLSLEYTDRIEQYQQEIKNLKENLHACRLSGSLTNRNQIIDSKIPDISTTPHYVTEEETLTAKAVDISTDKVYHMQNNSVQRTTSSIFNETTSFVENIVNVFNKVPARLGLFLNNNNNNNNINNNEHISIETTHGNDQEDNKKPIRYQFENNEVKKVSQYEVIENEFQNVSTIAPQPIFTDTAYNKVIRDAGESESERDTELEKNAQQFLKQQKDLSLAKNTKKIHGQPAERHSEKKKGEKDKENKETVLGNNNKKIPNNIEVQSVYNNVSNVILDNNNASNFEFQKNVDSARNKVESSKTYNPVQKPSFEKNSRVNFYKSDIPNSDLNNVNDISSLENINYTTIIPDIINNRVIPRQQNQLQPLKKYNKEIFLNPQSNDKQLKPPKTVVHNIGAKRVDKNVVNYIGANGNDKTLVTNIGANEDDKTAVNNIGANGDDKNVVYNIGANGDDKTVVNNIEADGDDKTVVNNIGAEGDDKQSTEYLNVQNERDKVVHIEDNQLQPPNLVKTEPIIQPEPFHKSFDVNTQKKNDVKNIKDVTLEDDEHGDQNLDNVNKPDYQEEKQIKADNAKLDSSLKKPPR